MRFVVCAVVTAAVYKPFPCFPSSSPHSFTNTWLPWRIVLISCTESDCAVCWGLDDIHRATVFTLYISMMLWPNRYWFPFLHEKASKCNLMQKTLTWSTTTNSQVNYLQSDLSISWRHRCQDMLNMIRPWFIAQFVCKYDQNK